MKITYLGGSDISIIEKATSMPYQSKPSKELVKKVWNMGHKSVARHSIVAFLAEDVSVSLLTHISRHPHINLTVKSSRYCNMENSDITIPPFIKKEDIEEYVKCVSMFKKYYIDWDNKENYTNKEKREITKMFLPKASTVDLVFSGNHQAMYEFLQLRLCSYHAEWEINELAIMTRDILKKEFPEIYEDCRKDCKNCRDKRCLDA